MAVRYVYRKVHEVMAPVWPRPEQVNVQHPEALCPCQCQDPAFFSLVWVLSNKMKMFILRLGSFIHEILNQKKGLSFCHSGLLGEGGWRRETGFAWRVLVKEHHLWKKARRLSSQGGWPPAIVSKALEKQSGFFKQNLRAVGESSRQSRIIKASCVVLIRSSELIVLTGRSGIEADTFANGPPTGKYWAWCWS